jgi:hypothetical protein
MLLIGTIIVLALWLAFVWFVDPGDFHGSKRLRLVRARGSSPTLSPRRHC